MVENSINRVTWQSPSNIALIKYWGKHSLQLPTNPSISITLDKSSTITSLSWEKTKPGTGTVDFTFKGERNEKFQTRIEEFLERIENYLPFLKDYYLEIKSSNNFPHSSGIASSASAMSALALCLIDMESQVSGQLHHLKDFYQKASLIARIGSGSACRSIYGGYILWGHTNAIPYSSDEFSVPVTDWCHPVFKKYYDAILLVTHQTKSLSSSAGHRLMKKNPYSEVKFRQSKKNTEEMIDILKKGEQMEFAHLVEAEALALHAMMMTSNPNYMLMQPNTVAIIHEVRNFRIQTDIPLCFTLDAGANVHLLYPERNREAVLEFIHSQLLKYCDANKWIDDRLGEGPTKLIE